MPSRTTPDGIAARYPEAPDQWLSNPDQHALTPPPMLHFALRLQFNTELLPLPLPLRIQGSMSKHLQSKLKLPDLPLRPWAVSVGTILLEWRLLPWRGEKVKRGLRMSWISLRSHLVLMSRKRKTIEIMTAVTNSKKRHCCPPRHDIRSSSDDQQNMSTYSKNKIKPFFFQLIDLLINSPAKKPKSNNKN